MRRLLLVAVALMVGVTAFALTRSDYRVYWMTPNGTVIAGITSAGRLDTLAGITAGGDLSITGNFATDGATIILDGSTSVRGVSAGFTSLEAPAIRFGVSATTYMQLAVSATTGNLAITHAGGSTNAVTWTAGSLAFTGNLSVDATTVLLDGATSVRGVSAGFVSLEGPSLRLGSDASFYMNVAVTTTTGVVAITHVGSGATTPAVTWTMGSLSLTGNFASDGATVSLDGSTSVRSTSAGFVSSEGPAVRFGANATEYMQVAVTATSGATAITHTGSGPVVTWTATSLAFTGDISADGATVLLDGSTSVRNVSAGFVSSEGPAVRFGVNATEYMQIATTATSGATAITHTGSGPAVTWTADSLAFTGSFSVDGTTVSLDGSTSVRGISAGFVSLEAPDIRFGANNADYMNVAVVATTGATTISHTGVTPTVGWTANSFGFTGDTTVTGTLAVTGDANFTLNIGHTGATNSGALMVSTNTVAYTNTAAKDLFVIPANAVVVDCVTIVTTTFNSDGTDLINVGPSGNPDAYVDDLDGAAAGLLRAGVGTLPTADFGTVGGSALTVQGIYATSDANNLTQGSVTVYLYWYLP